MAAHAKTVQQTPASEVSKDTLLKVAKEITIKFIEVGKISPATFEICFKDIYSTLDQTVRNNK